MHMDRLNMESVSPKEGASFFCFEPSTDKVVEAAIIPIL